MRFRVDVTGGVSVIDQNGIWETTPEGCAPYLDYAIVLDEEKNEYAVEFKVKQLLDPIEEGEEIGVFFRVIDKLNQGYGSQRSWYAESATVLAVHGNRNFIAKLQSERQLRLM